MMTLLTTLFLTSAMAEPLDRPLRPTTHPADPALSEGALENFQRVFVDPAEVIGTLKPIEATEGTGHLYIRNEYNGWVDVTVGGTKIGRIQPFTTAALHGVAAGTYDVDISVERVQYVDNEKIATVSEQLVLSPGNPSAAVAADPNYKKPGLQDNRVYPTGKLIGFSLPSVQSAE
jgi:hypothetical protein